MLDEIKWSEDRSYRTGSNNEPFQFYLDALSNSNQFNLLLGYFSSAAINVLSLGFATFLHNGGTLKMVVNNVLSLEDKNAILVAQNNEVDNSLIDLSDIKSLKKKLGEYGTHFFECLSWLIANKKIQIVIIKPKSNGIAHYKSGTFTDGKNTLSFKGSCNFTRNGLLANLEELEVFLNWEDDNGNSIKRVKRQEEEFALLFEKKADFVEYLEIDDVVTAIIDEFGDKTLDDLLVQEKILIEKKERAFQESLLLEQTNFDVKEISVNEPRFPYKEGPRTYQVEAYKKWVENGYKGIFAMATGTGKTITSLNCIIEQYKVDLFYRFIILVPTISLANQWEKEVSLKFNFQEVIVCSSINNNWEENIKRYGKNLRLGIEIDFCIIITYASFRGKRFQNLFNDLFKDKMNELTLIADEAHTLGSPKLLNVLPDRINKRIGLSATPERQYDEVGENKIGQFFNSYPPCYTFSYNMKKAIEDDVLCRFDYHPVIVELLPEELDEYRKISDQLVKYIDPNTGKFKEDDFVKMLLLKRKRIIHKAQNKSLRLLDIVNLIGKDNFNYVFIYVPEGTDPNYEEADIDKNDLEKDDDTIISEYTQLLFDNYKFRLRKFTGKTIDRDIVLKEFTSGNLDALLAMKCLDEGVDIPQTRIAIFCSSTGNPRQYIQRRGRVLRTHKGKERALIYDMIVKPDLDPTETDLERNLMEKNILANEVKRLVNFAVLAENKIECLRNIEELCYSYGIDVYELANEEETKYENCK